MSIRIASAVAATTLALFVAPSVAHADAPPLPAPAPISPDRAATPNEGPRFHLDIAPVVALPMGDLAQVTGPAIGGLLGGGYSLTDRWQLVGHAGYLEGATTSTQVVGLTVSSNLSYAPVLGGAKYYFLDPGAIRVYAMGEAGPVVASGSTSVSGMGTSTNGSASAMNLGGEIGLGLELDVLDLRAGLFTADIGHAGTSTSALLAMGFRFPSF